MKDLNYSSLQILLVTGGGGGTEIFDPSIGSWREGAALPSFAWGGPRAANIDNRVLLFGKDILMTLILNHNYVKAYNTCR